MKRQKLETNIYKHKPHSLDINLSDRSVKLMPTINYDI